MFRLSVRPAMPGVLPIETLHHCLAVRPTRRELAQTIALGKDSRSISLAFSTELMVVLAYNDAYTAAILCAACLLPSYLWLPTTILCT